MEPKVLTTLLCPTLMKSTLTREGCCGPTFFMCVPTQSARLIFIGENLVLKKLESPLILFYFKRENKTRKKTLKK